MHLPDIKFSSGSRSYLSIPCSCHCGLLDGSTAYPVEVLTLQRVERKKAAWILDEGFTGIYRIHARYKLGRVDVVRVARLGGEDAGIILLQRLTPQIGYVYYIAVARRFRHMGVGGALLDTSIESMKGEGINEVFAVRDEENIASRELFRSRQFAEVDMKEFRRRFGWRRSMRLMREMTLVSGEVLLRRELS